MGGRQVGLVVGVGRFLGGDLRALGEHGAQLRLGLFLLTDIDANLGQGRLGGETVGGRSLAFALGACSVRTDRPGPPGRQLVGKKLLRLADQRAGADGLPPVEPVRRLDPAGLGRFSGSCRAFCRASAASGVSPSLASDGRCTAQARSEAATPWRTAALFDHASHDCPDDIPPSTWASWPRFKSVAVTSDHCSSVAL